MRESGAMQRALQVGMTLPVMEPDLWEAPDTLERWARAIDEGPFSSLCFGERMAFANPHALTLLGAVTAWTTRVPLVTTVLVPQLHDPVTLAKALATADRLSRGRLTVGVGVGGREEDYRAAGADPATQTMQQMADRVAVMRRVWAGEDVTGATLPVGPPPLQAGGPPAWPGSPSTSTPPPSRGCSTWPAAPGRRRVGRRRTWRRRSGSPSMTVTAPLGPRCTATCGTT